MTETMQGILASAAWFAVALYATLHWIGGRSNTPKWIRRIVGGLLIAGATLTLAYVNHNFRAWMLIALVTLPAAISLGYGGDHVWEKVLRRSLWGLAVSGNSLIFAYFTGMWGVAGFQMLLGLAASVYFGVWNPFNNAPKEEAVIGGLCVVLIPFIV